ncbi:MAG: oxidoreductase [Myxococcota bacterium]
MATAAPSDPQFRPMRLHRSRALSPTVRSVVLETADGSSLQWRGGQHVELLVPPETIAQAPERWRADPAWLEEVRATKHPYSIASAPDPEAPGRLELAVGTSEGDSTSALLQRLSPGAQLGMVGPLGDFTREGLRDEPALFVATGTGLAPLRAMILDDLSRGPRGPELVLLFGCRREEDLLWYDGFNDLARRHPRFRYEPTLSQPRPDWRGRRGYVQEHLPELVRAAGPVPVFVAGQPEMVADVLRLLEIDLGHPPDRILREQYV